MSDLDRIRAIASAVRDAGGRALADRDTRPVARCPRELLAPRETLVFG